MLERLRARPEWTFFAVLPKADPVLATAWWAVLLLRGVLPAALAIVMGQLVGAVQRGDPLAGPLTWVGVVFVLLQMLTPIHQALGANLGDRTAAWLYDRLTDACVTPPGMGHLEDPTLTGDLTVARDFDLGMTGPPLSISMDFIAGGLVETAWRAVLRRGARRLRVVGAARTGGCLVDHALAAARERDLARPQHRRRARQAQRDAHYAYRLAVDPPPAKELRLFDLADWTLARFVARRTQLHALQYEATRLRERPVLWSVLLVTGGQRRRVLARWPRAPCRAS